MNPEQFFKDYDWQEAFKYAQEPALTQGATCNSSGPINESDVAEIIAYSEGENDGPSWLALFRLYDGRYLYLEAGCDYTGWDCQAGGSSWISDNLGNILQFGLTDEARQRFDMRKLFPHFYLIDTPKANKA